jgi:hypothetical protein
VVKQNLVFFTNSKLSFFLINLKNYKCMITSIICFCCLTFRPGWTWRSEFVWRNGICESRSCCAYCTTSTRLPRSRAAEVDRRVRFPPWRYYIHFQRAVSRPCYF